MSTQRCAPEADLHDADLRREAAVFRALADPSRATILATLARSDHPICVCDFTNGLGVQQSTVSHHLKLLKTAGLVTASRHGTWGYYALAAGARRLLDDALETIFARIR